MATEGLDFERCKCELVVMEKKVSLSGVCDEHNPSVECRREAGKQATGEKRIRIRDALL